MKIQQEKDSILISTPYSVPFISKVIENNRIRRDIDNTPIYIYEDEEKISIYEQLLNKRCPSRKMTMVLD
jgi:hypothetical protein